MFLPPTGCRVKLSAFTLVEVLAVLGILVVLVALLFPAVKKFRISAASTQCLANLRTLGAAHASYLAEHNGLGPPLWSDFEGHNSSGYGQLRPYYAPGPPFTWNGTKRLPLPKTDICPMVLLHRELDKDKDGPQYADYTLASGGHDINLSLMPDQAKLPILFDGWSATWTPSETVPLRHNNFNGINAVFLDGHVEVISQDKSDGRLYLNWWNNATRYNKANDSNLGNGPQVGSLTYSP